MVAWDHQDPGYIIFPIWEHGFVVSWQARACHGWSESEVDVRNSTDLVRHAIRRWKSAPTVEGWKDTKSCVWGLERIKKAGETIHVCEGIFDALYFRDKGGVAIMGTIAQPIQVIQILEKLPSKIVIVGQNDDMWARGIARMAAVTAFEKQWRNLDIEVIFPPNLVKDFGQLIERT